MSWRWSAPDVEMKLSCAGSWHRLRWHAGQVDLLDHPDLAAEQVLVALGGAEPACLSYLQLWHEALADGGFLGEWVDDTLLTEARLSWLAMALERLRMEGFHEFLRPLPAARAERMGQFIHRFPRPWLDRAASAVAESVANGSGVICDQAPGLLPAAVAHRLRRAFVASVGGRYMTLGAAALVPLTISVDDTRPISVTGALTGAHRAVTITVGARWLYRVWAAGASNVGGHLVLGAEPVDAAPGHQLRAVIVTWPALDTAQLEERTLSHDGLDWTFWPGDRLVVGAQHIGYRAFEAHKPDDQSSHGCVRLDVAGQEATELSLNQTMEWGNGLTGPQVVHAPRHDPSCQLGLFDQVNQLGL